MSANGTATPTISQYTTNTISDKVPDGTSFISAFTPSSFRRPPSKPRPKPKPNYVGTIDADEPAIRGHVDQIGSIESSSVTGKAQPIPLPESTFTADISERIKARRALESQKNKTAERKLPCGVKKPALAVEAVIDISSDEDMPSGSSHIPVSSKHPRKQSNKAQSVSSFGSDVPALGQTSLRDEVKGDRNTSPAGSRKRKRDPPSNSDTPPAPVAADGTSNRLGFGIGQDAEPLPKQKKKVIDGAGDEVPLSEKANKKRRKDKEQQPKKSCAKSKPIDKEKDQFKSSEFILNSDDELTLGNHGDANIGAVAAAETLPVTTTVVSSRSIRSPGSKQSGGTEKAAHRKRKITAETENNTATADIEGASGLSLLVLSANLGHFGRSIALEESQM